MSLLSKNKAAFCIAAAGLLAMLAGCAGEPEDTRFLLLQPSETNIDFENRIENTPEFNIINYLYFYDGGGVAIGDINNNGLPDIFLTANDGPNRLFKNLGDYRFEDITETAGIEHIPDSWSTGVTIADVTGNGYPDIYISNSSYGVKSGRNQFFVNNGDGTFTEKAREWGIDFEGYSTQAAFFDYNQSGRLDMFLLNHSFHSDRTYGQAERLRLIPDPKAGDRLFRNEGDYFTDVTQEAGIISSALGYGLGVAITDINKNGLPDIYIGNDFHEDDYLYINNDDGTFTEMLYDYFVHTSYSSMGNDVADLTNDGNVDVFSLDMMAEDYETYMRSGGPDLYAIAKSKRDAGFGAKNERNTIQINRGLSPEGKPVFSEMAFALGLAKTEWSWAALMADFDNSGFKDIFVTNGMPHRPNDLDHTARMRLIRQQDDPEKVKRDEFRAIDLMPEVIVPNYMFKNHGDLRFENVTGEWGLSRPGVSNGAAWADLNNSGRLDLVVNNINETVRIYKNTTPVDSAAGFLQVKLEGSGMNTGGIGSKVILYKDREIFYQEHMPTRGFQSSVDHVLHFGLGAHESVDSLLVIWPDWSYQTMTDVSANQRVTVRQGEASGEFDFSRLHRSYEHAYFRASNIEIDFRHTENTFADYRNEPLMPYKLSRQGPALAVGDVTGNGLDDVFIGGARHQAGRLFLQHQDGTFRPAQQNLFETDRNHEDVDAVFFDANGNGYPDLYVMSGGGELAGMEDGLLDRLYLNDGNGVFSKSEGLIPVMYLNGSVVRPHDITGNGKDELFVASRSIPWRYGHSPGHYLLGAGDDGTYGNITNDFYPELIDLGMVTDAVWADLDGNGTAELVIVGEWMPVTVLALRNGRFENVSSEFGLRSGGGLWQSVHAADVNGNGRKDLILGNFGTNSRIDASPDKKFHLLKNEFGDDGRESFIIAIERQGSLYPFDRLDELLLEFPFLTEKISSYRDFSTKDLNDLFGRSNIAEAGRRSLEHMESGVYLNQDDGTFVWNPFPIEAQAFPVMGIDTYPHESGTWDILLAGNLHHIKPGTGGKQGAGRGLHIRYDRDEGLRTVMLQHSGFYVPGESRKIAQYQAPNGIVRWIVGRNNNTPLVFEIDQ